MYPAIYFDGLSARAHAVELQTRDKVIVLTGDNVVKVYSYARARLAEPFDNAPCILDFSDGARCELATPAARQALERAMKYRKSSVVRLQERWLGALAALLLLLAAAFAAVEWGIPALAEYLIALVPAQADRAFGAKALEQLDKTMFEPSRLSEQRIAEVEGIFRTMQPATPRMPLRLLVRASPRLKANALALPDGTIVITDDMVRRTLGPNNTMDETARGQLAGILAHEIGHVQHRHSMRAIARSSITVAASSALFGDVSALASAAPALLVNMNHSRAMETEADDYALAALKKHGIPPALLAILLDELDAEADAQIDRHLPRWLRTSMGFASSHPSGAARSARLRAAH